MALADPITGDEGACKSLILSICGLCHMFLVSAAGDPGSDAKGKTGMPFVVLFL